jgi:small subunit ribosomal protein S1
MDDSVMTTQPQELEPGQTVKGTVKKISLAAALVDIGTEKPAVLHVSQLETPGKEPIKKVEDVLSVDQEIEAYVKRVTKEVIQLTMLKPVKLPWRKIEDGLVVKGTVVRLETFGAFVEIGAERPGLVHISEIAHGYIKTPGDVLKEGQEIEVQVLESDRRKRQIKLSIKALQEPPEASDDFSGQPDSYQDRDRSSNDRGGYRGGGGGGRRPRREKQTNVKQALKEVNEPVDETDTAMAAALRAAMEGASNGDKESKSGKRSKDQSAQDDILSRTLGSRSDQE